jgi:predicted DNA-binding transcriptional regulator YafY
MNSSDQLKIDIIEQLNSKKIILETAIKVLNVSQRTIERYTKDFSEFGVTYFQHGNQGHSKALDAFHSASSSNFFN